MFIQMQDWPSMLEECFGFLDVLPGMKPPGMNLFSPKPAANGTGRDDRQGRS